MYKSILIGLLIFLLPSLSFSEWKNIAENNEAKIYVDLGSIRKVDDGIKRNWLGNEKETELEMLKHSSEIKLISASHNPEQKTQAQQCHVA